MIWVHLQLWYIIIILSRRIMISCKWRLKLNKTALSFFVRSINIFYRSRIFGVSHTNFRMIFEGSQRERTFFPLPTIFNGCLFLFLQWIGNAWKLLIIELITLKLSDIVHFIFQNFFHFTSASFHFFNISRFFLFFKGDLLFRDNHYLWYLKFTLMIKIWVFKSVLFIKLSFFIYLSLFNIFITILKNGRLKLRLALVLISLHITPWIHECLFS